jgi:hypothetical protein
MNHLHVRLFKLYAFVSFILKFTNSYFLQYWQLWRKFIWFVCDSTFMNNSINEIFLEKFSNLKMMIKDLIWKWILLEFKFMWLFLIDFLTNVIRHEYLKTKISFSTFYKKQFLFQIIIVTHIESFLEKNLKCVDFLWFAGSSNHFILSELKTAKTNVIFMFIEP